MYVLKRYLVVEYRETNIFKNERFLEFTLQAFVEPIELVLMTNVSRLS